MARRLLALLTVSLAALAVASAALAKEGANLMNYPTNGTDAGSPWNAQFEAFSHDGNVLAPAVMIRNKAGKTQRFDARQTGTRRESGGPGVVYTYRSDVVFPSAGVWTYGVQLRPEAPTQWFDDSAVIIDPAPPAPSAVDDGFEVPLGLLPFAALLLLGAAGAFFGRRTLRAWVTTALR